MADFRGSHYSITWWYTCDMYIADIIWLPQVIDKLAWKHNVMNDTQEIPTFQNYEEIGEFWDSHSLADFWEQTEPADFEIASNARRRYLVASDPTPNSCASH